MNGYLVIYSHGMDDLPIRLCRDLAEATEFADKVTIESDEHIQQLFGVECCTPCGVQIVEFVNGEPTRVIAGKEFD